MSPAAFLSGKAALFRARPLDARQDGAANFSNLSLRLCAPFDRWLERSATNLRRRSSHGCHAQEREEESQTTRARGKETSAGAGHRGGGATSQRRWTTACISGTCNLARTQV